MASFSGRVKARSASSLGSSFSSTTTDEETNPPRSSHPPRRQSSIRFSQDTRTESHSPMSNRRRPSVSDEITPIRTADGHPDRRYHTNSETGDADHDNETEAVGTQRQAQGPNTKTAPAQIDGTAKEPEDKVPWYKRVVEKYGAVSLENKGSVARDHLALERTFLAWLRTSLAFASIGIAITQLFRLNTAIASHSERYSGAETRTISSQQDLPFSPLFGHSLPIELVEYLRWQSQQSGQQPASPPTLGPTLLDQLLLLPPPTANGQQIPTYSSSDFTISAFDEDAAAKLRHVGKPLGATFLAISIVILFVGFHRYFEAQYWIVRGKFPASRGSVALVAFITMTLIVASLVVVLVVAPSSFEKR